MRDTLNTKEKELYRRTDEILHYLWDPIGVSDTPQARDEYHGYFPKVFARLIEGAEAHTIAEYLTTVESREMGMTQNNKKALEVAHILIETKKWLIDEAL